MTTSDNNKTIHNQVKEILAQDGDLLRNIIQEIIQEILQTEMDQALGASKSERTSSRLGNRASQSLRTGVAHQRERRGGSAGR